MASSFAGSSSCPIGDQTFIVSVTLTKEIVESQENENFPAFLITINACDEDGCPAPVFVYQREVIDISQTDPAKRDKAFFTQVASPVDWQDLPIGVPTDEDIILFRHHELVAATRSREEAEFVWDEVVKDVRNLIEHHKFLLGEIGGGPIDEIEIS